MNGISIEKEIVVESILNGGGFDYSWVEGFGDPFEKVFKTVCAVIDRALTVGFLPDEVAERSEVKAAKDAEAAELERKRLEFEESELNAEIERLDAEDRADGDEAGDNADGEASDGEGGVAEDVEDVEDYV